MTLYDLDASRLTAVRSVLAGRAADERIALAEGI